MLKSSIKTSKTSIIITTFNDAEYLKRSLPSVINQTLKPLEIIIIDDGSDNDNAKLIINSFKSITDIPLVFKKKSNGGPSSARNVGIKLANGEVASLTEKRKLKLPKDIIIGIRPENITEMGSKNKQNAQVITSNIDIVEPAGSDTYVVTKLGETEVTARFHSETKVKIGSKIDFLLDLEKASYFNPTSGKRI